MAVHQPCLAATVAAKATVLVARPLERSNDNHILRPSRRRRCERHTDPRRASADRTIREA